jgi:hypothetical protein
MEDFNQALEVGGRIPAYLPQGDARSPRVLSSKPTNLSLRAEHPIATETSPTPKIDALAVKYFTEALERCAE